MGREGETNKKRRKHSNDCMLMRRASEKERENVLVAAV